MLDLLEELKKYDFKIICNPLHYNDWFCLENDHFYIGGDYEKRIMVSHKPAHDRWGNSSMYISEYPFSEADIKDFLFYIGLINKIVLRDNFLAFDYLNDGIPIFKGDDYKILDNNPKLLTKIKIYKLNDMKNVEDLTSEMARKLTNEYRDENELNDILSSIYKKADKGKDRVHIYKDIQINTIRELKDRGFKVISHTSTMDRIENLYYTIEW